MFTWGWRGFIFSLSIAVFAAMSSPAQGVEHPLHTQQPATLQLAELTHELAQTSITQSLAILSQQTHLLNKLADLKNSRDNSNTPIPNKSPASQISTNPNITSPPFERYAASVFGSVSQNVPIFVLVYEFQPEILSLKHFLAPIDASTTLWYLRPDASNNHGRLGGWKDGNTLYTGTITYLS